MPNSKLRISEIPLRLWNSPTFTQWSAKVVQPLRLLLVTPLILTGFSKDEIAAWYLFASINFLGQIVGSRVLLTFSRMIAMAMGGAKDLSPIIAAQRKSKTNEPNWDSIFRVYRSLGFIQLIVAAITVIAAANSNS